MGKTWRRSRGDGILAAILALTRDPVARDLLMEMALARDYGLCCAVFGTEAFRVLANDPPGLLVVDIDIPDGRALVRSLRGDERWRGIPLIGLARPTNPQLDLIRDALVYLKPELIGLEEAIASRFEPDGDEPHEEPYLFDGSSPTTAWH